EILMMQGDGDKSRVELFISKYGNISEQVKGALEKHAKIPIDVRPLYEIERDIKQIIDKL
ncbi:10959_t:CDS:2, partial [Funneliformis geosporum]